MSLSIRFRLRFSPLSRASTETIAASSIDNDSAGRRVYVRRRVRVESMIKRINLGHSACGENELKRRRKIIINGQQRKTEEKWSPTHGWPAMSDMIAIGCACRPHTHTADGAECAARPRKTFPIYLNVHDFPFHFNLHRNYYNKVTAFLLSFPLLRLRLRRVSLASVTMMKN